MVKEGDIITRNGKEYAVIEVRPRTFVVRRWFKDISQVGASVLTLPKKWKPLGWKKNAKNCNPYK